MEHRLEGMLASVVVIPSLSSKGSIAVVHRLSHSMACGILLDQGSKLCLLQLAGRFFTTEPPGKPKGIYFNVVDNVNHILQKVVKFR